jgi:hypothetical protein
MAKASAGDMWHHPEGGAPVEDITGFAIQARDGDVGKVDTANAETGFAHLIVGRTVMLPAGVIERIDYKHRVVHVNRDMDDIKNAPEYDDASSGDENYRARLGEHYAGLDS